MISVKPLTDEGKTQFEKLFSKYYSELDCGENVKHLVDEYILPDLLAGLIRIELLKDGDTYAGFVIYQKDDLKKAGETCVKFTLYPLSAAKATENFFYIQPS